MAASSNGFVPEIANLSYIGHVPMIPITCRKWYMFVNFFTIDLNFQEYITDKSTCDPKTGIWALTDGTTIRYAELFAPMCVFRGKE